jgi:hypothetical protein
MTMTAARTIALLGLLIVDAFGTSAAAEKTQIPASSLKPRAIHYSPFEAMNSAQIGTWLFAANVSGTLSDAMWLNIDGTTHTGSNGTVYLVVDHVFSATPLGLVAYESYGKWLLLLDAGTSYYRLYEYDANHDEAAGLYWLYPMSGSPSGNGSWMRGFRFANGTGGVLRSPSVLDATSAASRDSDIAQGQSGDAPARITATAVQMAYDFEQLRR